MSRTKLIAQYAALDTKDLAQRIHQVITDHIAENGIEDLPILEFHGRWTGKLYISEDGWRGDFDFLNPVLSMCRVDREGNVFADIEKIEKRVAQWRETLYTPHEDDRHLGVCDHTFDENDYTDDEAHAVQSSFYKDEISNFLKTKHPEVRHEEEDLHRFEHLCDDSTPLRTDSKRMFSEGFAVQKISSAEDYRTLMEAIQAHAAAGGGYAWINPDFDMDSIEDMFAEGSKHQKWMQWIDDLRNHRLGSLPADFDGLAEESEE